MAVKQKIKYYFADFVNLRKQLKGRAGDSTYLDSMAAELIRNTHSIEKGLSIKEPRLGFGHAKHKEMMREILMLKESDSEFHAEACKMAVGALKEYIEYHETRGFRNEVIDEITVFLQNNSTADTAEKYGGTVLLNKSELCFNIAEIEKLFNTRHSIRDFDEGRVDQKLLKKALRLAQKAPSACNRQAVRVYVMNDKQKEIFSQRLSGIGGFADAADKYIIITAKTSSYRLEEKNQYIVSASMYAAYLSLTLHAYGMGACVVQSPVIWSRQWSKNRKWLGIDEDEQIICLILVGKMKDSCKVPVSHRLADSIIVKWL